MLHGIFYYLETLGDISIPSLISSISLFISKNKLNFIDKFIYLSINARGTLMKLLFYPVTS